jgi:hypothetical protein
MPYRDEIVEEVRAARDAFAARFNYDLDAMFDYLKAKEQEHPERLAKIKPAEPKLPVNAG